MVKEEGGEEEEEREGICENQELRENLEVEEK